MALGLCLPMSSVVVTSTSSVVVVNLLVEVVEAGHMGEGVLSYRPTDWINYCCLNFVFEDLVFCS